MADWNFSVVPVRARVGIFRAGQTSAAATKAQKREKLRNRFPVAASPLTYVHAAGDKAARHIFRRCDSDSGDGQQFGGGGRAVRRHSLERLVGEDAECRDAFSFRFRQTPVAQRAASTEASGAAGALVLFAVPRLLFVLAFPRRRATSSFMSSSKSSRSSMRYALQYGMLLPSFSKTSLVSRTRPARAIAPRSSSNSSRVMPPSGWNSSYRRPVVFPPPLRRAVITATAVSAFRRRWPGGSAARRIPPARRSRKCRRAGERPRRSPKWRTSAAMRHSLLSAKRSIRSSCCCFCSLCAAYVSRQRSCPRLTFSAKSTIAPP